MIRNVAARAQEFEETLVGEETNVRGTLRGIGASAGIAVAPCRVITRVEDLHTVEQGAILVFPFATPKLIPYMEIAGGLVTEERVEADGHQPTMPGPRVIRVSPRSRDRWRRYGTGR